MIYAAIAYFIIISVVGIIMTLRDKSAAVVRGRRIPEKTLMITGLLGAALAMFITMNIIRHKTKHLKFMIGLPLEAILHAAIIAAAIIYL